MITEKQIELIKSASIELEKMIDKVNDGIKKSYTGLDEPDRFDHETCYDLLVLARDLESMVEPQVKTNN